jgi:hypothetical protein
VFKNLFRKPIFIASAAVCALLVASTYFMRRSRKVALQLPLTSLQELNEEFKRQYKNAADNFWNSQIGNGSVIMEKFSSITLFHKGAKYSIPNSIPPIYHDLKSFAHIPLTIYLLFKNSSTVTDDTLKKYLQHLNNLKVPDSIQSKEKDSVDRIVSESQKLLQKEMDKKGSVDLQVLTDFCRSLAKDLDVLLNAAATAHLNKIHEIIQGWTNEHNFDRKDPLVKVLLIGPRSNRQNNLQTTYFERLLDDEQRRHIVYTEELFGKEEQAQSIFSKWFLDEELSTIFFNDQDRMHSELLMNDSVKKQIHELIPF